MRYFGGKARLGRQIASVINDVGSRTYHEPFCGMFSVGRHVKANRSGSDIHEDLILLLNAVASGWTGPTNLTEEEYREQKTAEPSPLRAFAGFGCSFGGKFFGGYARNNTTRNYASNASKSLVKLYPMIQGVEFRCQNYLDYEPIHDVIYCDPPYAGVTGFSSGDFNSNAFWDWVRKISKDSKVFVSEYEAPKDFKVVWEKSVKTDMNSKDSTKLPRIERLFSLTD